MINKFNNLEKFLLIIVALSGSLIFFFPIQYLFIGLVVLASLLYLLANPKICFYLILITSPFFVGGFRMSEGSGLPFNQSDILITICFLGLFFRNIFTSQINKVSIRTKIDLWLIVLFILHLFFGFNSISHRGYQGFLRYGEIAATFYMTIYFLRTKEVKLSELVKVIIFVGLFEALYGILQSLTGSLGANFQSTRGYLGYLGIGSSLVWHGQGSFPHFNSLGPFLNLIFLFFLPINYFIAKDKRRGYIILAILFFGVVTTYSRGSLLALIVGILFFKFQTISKKSGFLMKLTPLALFIFMAMKFLKNTSYVNTISPRNELWAIAITSITSSPKNFFFGSGLQSYLDAIHMLIPANVLPTQYLNYVSHNFILYYAVEMGIIGAGSIVLFLINNLVYAYKCMQTNNLIIKVISSSITLIIVSFFIEGMFDTAFNQFNTQIWLYIILGLLYAKTPKLLTKNI